MSKRKPRFKFPTQNGLKSVERSYQRLVQKYHRRYTQLVREELSKILPALRQESKGDVPNPVDIATDDVDNAPLPGRNMPKAIDQAMQNALQRLNAEFPEATLRRWGKMITERVDNTTSRDVQAKANKEAKSKIKAGALSTDEGNVSRFDSDIKILGVPVLRETTMSKEMAAFFGNVINHNVGLIQSISGQGSDEIKTALSQMILENRPQRDIAKMLRDKFGKSRARSSLIARDQVTKLNGSVNRVKQQSLGVTHYIWRSVSDDAVRDRHRDLNGKKFAWDDPPVISPDGRRGHPGDDYQCRCYAEAVLDDLI